ncbi:ABC transporter ATP-binding protein [Jannaschia seohaensis]|uniref:Branched-chain amino acid transport system ATP-binding protein n=1 Tax=Jannaschia seohaensis TaxID=475081 RepID=A0A2Y9AEI4_9RHOB|nr:ABC transporter ATP-binding protein [Jannaschia seohaensis]PWJ21278.1 branched-chain amino acid transport system ATP-binding protein [Jannaschia seohaensis]SSA41688.1 branched-chain amino acid transport system ATP-binding protein [Jannaschia seohaensis]
MASVILETKGLTKLYGGLAANTDVDFELPRGRITALIGPNGAGKSTFVGMVTGRIPATRGQVIFEGRDISALPAHARIALGMAYTFQITSIFPGLDVAENVALAARRTTDAAHLDAKVRDTLARVGLNGRGNALAGDLSYGHQRLLEIAMGLAQDPRLFILDEPTQGLAESEVAGFIDLVRGLAGEATILLIEHNMDVVMQLADHIVVLDQGQVLASGAPEAIRADRAVQSAYLGTADA